MTRLLAALLVFVSVLALGLLLGTPMSGEMAAGDLAAHGSGVCRTCPPTEQLTGAGLTIGDDRWYVNVRFAAPPINAVVRVRLEGVDGAIELQQVGAVWHQTGRARAGALTVTSVSQRDELLVIGLPASLRAAGVAVATAGGDRLPDTGFVAPQYGEAPHFNTADVVLIAILLVTGWMGFRRGAPSEVANLLAIVVSVAIAALAYRPVASAFTSLTHSARAGAALGSGALVLGAALVSVLVLPKLLAPLARSMASIDRSVSSVAGLLLASARQLVVLAMIVTIGTDAAVLHWAARSLNSSILGAALIHAWRTLFAAA